MSKVVAHGKRRTQSCSLLRYTDTDPVAVFRAIHSKDIESDDTIREMSGRQMSVQLLLHIETEIESNFGNAESRIREAFLQ